MTTNNTGFHVIVCGILVNEINQVFLARRSPDKKLGGLWEFPGGKLEHGEELEDALKREFIEELDMQIQVDELLHIKPYVYNHGAVLILFYLCSYVDGGIVLRDHDKHGWFEADKIPELKLLPANQEVIEMLQDLLYS